MRRWPRPRPALARGSTFTTQSALTKASVTARRARFTRKACGYVDDRLRRPAALPPLPKRAWKAGKCSPSPTYPLRQEKSWKGEWKCSLKPFEAAQRVRLPPGRGAARQPEASLAWATVTSLVKRRQRKLKPCVSLEIGYPLRPSVLGSRGRHRHDRQRRGRVGSAGVVEQGKGLGRVAREPVRSRVRPRVQYAGQGPPAEQGPRPHELPPGSSGALRRARTQEER